MNMCLETGKNSTRTFKVFRVNYCGRVFKFPNVRVMKEFVDDYANYWSYLNNSIATLSELAHASWMLKYNAYEGNTHKQVNISGSIPIKFKDSRLLTRYFDDFAKLGIIFTPSKNNTLVEYTIAGEEDMPTAWVVAVMQTLVNCGATIINNILPNTPNNITVVSDGENIIFVIPQLYIPPLITPIATIASIASIAPIPMPVVTLG